MLDIHTAQENHTPHSLAAQLLLGGKTPTEVTKALESFGAAPVVAADALADAKAEVEKKNQLERKRTLEAKRGGEKSFLRDYILPESVADFKDEHPYIFWGTAAAATVAVGYATMKGYEYLQGKEAFLETGLRDVTPMSQVG